MKNVEFDRWKPTFRIGVAL